MSTAIAPASGQEFALLPPDNATGNFTKIVQRIPVKIALDAGSRAIELRPGMSVIPTIADHVRQRRRRRPRPPHPNVSAKLDFRRVVPCQTSASQPRRHAAPAATPDRTRRSIPNRASATVWIAVFAAMIGAFMAILNIQITNASLLNIEGGIGTGVDNGSWISTSYLIGEIIVIPLTDYLSRVFSFRNIMLAFATLFAAFSVACAFTHDLPSMIAMRGFQGFFGGVLIPMAFTLVFTKLPKAQQPIGLAMFSLAVTFAPAIGPTIGGYLTENYGWQTIFFVNVVPTAVMVTTLYLHAGAPADAARPAARRRLVRHRHHGGRPRRAAGRARGRQQGRLVRLALHRQARDRRRGQPVAVRLNRARRREAAAPAAAADAAQFRLRHHRAVFLGFALFGSVYLLPAYLGQVQGYNAEQIGNVLAWTGLPQLLLIPLVPKLMQRFDTRYIAFAGLLHLRRLARFMNMCDVARLFRRPALRSPTSSAPSARR